MLGGMVGGFAGPMDWKGAGFGGTAGGTLGHGGGYLGGDLGLGIGAGYSEWAKDGMTGVSGVTGGVAPVDLRAGVGGVNAGASTNGYSGLGGSAYSMDDGSGFGGKGNAVALGGYDTNLGLSTPYGSADAHADNAYMTKVSGETQFGNNKGTYYGDVSGGVHTGVEGFKSEIATPLGDLTHSAKSIKYGTGGGSGGSYDSKTGDAGMGVATSTPGCREGHQHRVPLTRRRGQLRCRCARDFLRLPGQRRHGLGSDHRHVQRDGERPGRRHCRPRFALGWLDRWRRFLQRQAR